MTKQPPRTDRDGQVAVKLTEDESVMVIVGDRGTDQTVTMSRFNAFRMLGMLSLFLGAPLSKDAAKGIKL